MNCETEIALLVLFSSAYWIEKSESYLKFTLLMLMAHFGCVYSLMYWFLIKAWHYYNSHFAFNLIKEFLSLVCTSFAYELEIKERRYIVSTEVLRCYFWCRLLMVVDSSVCMYSTTCFLNSCRVLSATWACSRIDPAAHTTYPFPPSLEFTWDWSEFSILLMYFKVYLSFKFWEKLLSGTITAASGNKHILKGVYEKKSVYAR